jgi:hypothetical protein
MFSLSHSLLWLFPLHQEVVLSSLYCCTFMVCHAYGIPCTLHVHVGVSASEVNWAFIHSSHDPSESNQVVVVLGFCSIISSLLPRLHSPAFYYTKRLGSGDEATIITSKHTIYKCEPKMPRFCFLNVPPNTCSSSYWYTAWSETTWTEGGVAFNPQQCFSDHFNVCNTQYGLKHCRSVPY